MKNIISIIIFLTLAGCAVQESVHIKDGKEYGVTDGLFRGRWWNHYERGLSYADGEFYDEAIHALNTAVQKRSDDNWRSRTYGMHFVNYFPHRELGVIYYRTKKYRAAEQELEGSLKTAESAKAKYFLNRTRKAILEERGDDKLPPSIRIDTPSEGSITNKTSITLKGEAFDDHFVSTLSVNGTPVPVELSAKRIPLEKEQPLEKGMNEIEIKVSDLTGKTVEKKVSVLVDREGPVILIDEQHMKGNKLLVSGFVSDRTNIRSLQINDEMVPLVAAHEKVRKPHSFDGDHEVRFKHEIDLPKGTDTVILRAQDEATNVTTGELSVSQSTSGLSNQPLLASSAGSILGKMIDNIKPVIHVKDLKDLQTVYSASFFLEGSVSDNRKISSLFINGESVIKRKGMKVFFNYLTSLKEGVNILFIEAVDVVGNKTEQIVTVIRKISKIRQIGSRMSLSVLPLANKGDRSVAGDAVYDSLISSFVNQKRFQLVEREKMEEVLRELKLSQSELVDRATASKIGKIIVADAILTGTILEKKDSIEILTRLVDTDTSNILDAKDVFDEDKSLKGIKRLMEGLALKYRESFPLLEGLVVKKEGKSVFTDLGADSRIKKNMTLILFREGDAIIHPLSKKVLGIEPVTLGEAKIENVYEGYSQATIKRGKPSNVKIKDRIITK